MKRKRQLLLGLMLVLPACCPDKAHAAATASPRGDYVVLLHGLGRTPLSMKRLEWSLQQAGYRVVNLSYPSTRVTIEQAARDYLAEGLRDRISDPAAKVHFVTHSLGGIVLRQYLAEHTLPNLGRVVMLAPPNHGSELADHWKPHASYAFFTGPSGQQLGTDASSIPLRLGPANFELGIIAGDRSLNPRFSAHIPGPNDGKVSVASARLEGMRDFLVVHHSHTWLPWCNSAVRGVLEFLATGTFTRASAG